MSDVRRQIERWPDWKLVGTGIAKTRKRFTFYWPARWFTLEIAFIWHSKEARDGD